MPNPTLPIAIPSPIVSPDGFAKSIHDSLAQAVAAIPTGKTNALVVDGTYDKTNGPGFQAVWLHKVNDDFEIAASGAYDGPHGAQGKVQGILAW